MQTHDETRNIGYNGLLAIGGQALVKRLEGATADRLKLGVGLSGIDCPCTRLQALLHLANWVQPLGFEQSRVMEQATTRTLGALAEAAGPFKADAVDACFELLAGTDPLQAALRRDTGSCEHFEMVHKDRGGTKSYYYPTDEAALAFLHDVQEGKRPMAEPIKHMALDKLRTYEFTQSKALGSLTKLSKLHSLRLAFESELVGRPFRALLQPLAVVAIRPKNGATVVPLFSTPTQG